MAKKKNAAAVALGKLGGAARVPKGFAMFSAEDRRAAALKGVASRRRNAREAKKRLASAEAVREAMRSGDPMGAEG